MTMSLNTALQMDPHVSRLVRPVTHNISVHFNSCRPTHKIYANILNNQCGTAPELLSSRSNTETGQCVLAH